MKINIKKLTVSAIMIALATVLSQAVGAVWILRFLIGEKTILKIRKMIKDEKINGKVMVICSDEQGKVTMNKEIPSNSFVPAVAGLLCASFVINDIVGDINV